MILSSVASALESSAVTLTSRITITRSLTARISGSSDDTVTIAAPLAASAASRP